MLIEKNSKIGDVVAKNFKTVEVFESYGLDFCCGGKKTIENACTEKGLNTEEVIRNLSSIQNGNGQVNHNFTDWSLTFLADYIINVHHTYVSNNAPRIFEHAEKVASVHGERHPEMTEVFRLFSEVKEDLSSHMMKEERMLFPYIKLIEQVKASGKAAQHPPFGTVDNPIRMMEMEHENAGNMLARINEITNGYKAPDDACGTFRVLLKELEDFEKDLHTHVHLENNILFPKASELEKSIMYN